MNHITLIGQSHTQCIIEALIAVRQPVHWGFLSDGNGTNPLVESDGAIVLQPDLVSQLSDKAQQSRLCVSTIGGNAHTVMGLVEMTPAFDFEMPGVDAPLNADAQLIPYQMVKAAMLRRLQEGDFKFVDAVLQTVPETKLHLASPPPPKDNAVCMALIDPHFVQTHPNIKIADPWLRLKLWKLHSQLFEDKFREAGRGFLPVPPEAQTDEGFIRLEYLNEKSCTHANVAYGHLVATQLLGLQ